MNTLINRLVIYVNTCLKRDVNYEIASYIIKNYLRCEEVLLSEICECCYVSRASVTRFCKLFGFDSWIAFHQFLVRTKRIREQQVEDRFRNLDFNKIYETIQNIAQREDSNFLAQVQKDIDILIELIQSSKRVCLYGAIYPLSLAVNFQMDMISSGKVIYCDFQGDSNPVEQLGEDDVAIVLTASGRYITECKESINQIYQAKAKIVVISSSEQYREMRYIDHYIYMPPSARGGIKDFDYYIMTILDLAYLKYQHNRIGVTNNGTV